ncbi:hypothetical protein Baya_14606 [Bagarius yarrelli]|uniref:Uncharacterized protein n=1 Tax=Bagarius yarrelli TaxID=175774 RepID=A0A556V9H7_BAGYA|nr:hypothetical protein Baya_14606 [Bagarius yarrelli]
MDAKAVCAVCLVLWLLTHVDDVISRPMEQPMTEAAGVRIQRKELISGCAIDRRNPPQDRL